MVGFGFSELIIFEKQLIKSVLFERRDFMRQPVMDMLL